METDRTPKRYIRRKPNAAYESTPGDGANQLVLPEQLVSNQAPSASPQGVGMFSQYFIVIN
jgi:hypothetical protein